MLTPKDLLSQEEIDAFTSLPKQDTSGLDTKAYGVTGQGPVRSNISLTELDEFRGGPNTSFAAPDLRADLDRYQSTGDAILNSVTNAGAGAVLQFAEGAVTLLSPNSWFNSEAAINNSILRNIAELREELGEATPVYTESEGMMDADADWWIKSLGDLTGSALGFVGLGKFSAATLGRVITNASSKTLRAMSAGLSNMGRTSAAEWLGLRAGAITGTTAGLANSIAMNHAETVAMTTSMYWDTLVDQMRNQNKDFAEADALAKEAASFVFTRNRINIATNLISGGLFVKPSTRSILTSPSFKRNLLMESGFEGVEELINTGVEAGAKAKISGKSVIDEALKAMFSEQGLESFVLGAIGGAAQTAFTGRKEVSKQKEAFEKQQASLAAMSGNIKSILSDPSSQTAEWDTLTLNTANSLLMGTTGRLLDSLEEVQRMTDEELREQGNLEPELTRAKVGEAITMVKDMEQFYINNLEGISKDTNVIQNALKIQRKVGIEKSNRLELSYQIANLEGKDRAARQAKLSNYADTSDTSDQYYTLDGKLTAKGLADPTSARAKLSEVIERQKKDENATVDPKLEALLNVLSEDQVSPAMQNLIKEREEVDQRLLNLKDQFDTLLMSGPQPSTDTEDEGSGQPPVEEVDKEGLFAIEDANVVQDKATAESKIREESQKVKDKILSGGKVDKKTIDKLVDLKTQYGFDELAEGYLTGQDINKIKGLANMTDKQLDEIVLALDDTVVHTENAEWASKVFNQLQVTRDNLRNLQNEAQRYKAELTDIANELRQAVDRGDNVAAQRLIDKYNRLLEEARDSGLTTREIYNAGGTNFPAATIVSEAQNYLNNRGLGAISSDMTRKGNPIQTPYYFEQVRADSGEFTDADKLAEALNAGDYKLELIDNRNAGAITTSKYAPDGVRVEFRSKNQIVAVRSANNELIGFLADPSVIEINGRVFDYSIQHLQILNSGFVTYDGEGNVTGISNAGKIFKDSAQYIQGVIDSVKSGESPTLEKMRVSSRHKYIAKDKRTALNNMGNEYMTTMSVNGEPVTGHLVVSIENGNLRYTFYVDGEAVPLSDLRLRDHLAEHYKTMRNEINLSDLELPVPGAEKSLSSNFIAVSNGNQGWKFVALDYPRIGEDNPTGIALNPNDPSKKLGYNAFVASMAKKAENLIKLVTGEDIGFFRSLLLDTRAPARLFNTDMSSLLSKKEFSQTDLNKLASELNKSLFIRTKPGVVTKIAFYKDEAKGKVIPLVEAYAGDKTYRRNIKGEFTPADIEKAAKLAIQEAGGIYSGMTFTTPSVEKQIDLDLMVPVSQPYMVSVINRPTTVSNNSNSKPKDNSTTTDGNKVVKFPKDQRSNWTMRVDMNTGDVYNNNTNRKLDPVKDSKLIEKAWKVSGYISSTTTPTENINKKESQDIIIEDAEVVTQTPRRRRRPTGTGEARPDIGGFKVARDPDKPDRERELPSETEEVEGEVLKKFELNQPIELSYEEGIAELKKLVPEEVISNQELEEVISNISISGVPLGVVIDGMVHLSRKGVSSTTAAHEAMHIVSRVLMNSNDQARLMRAARSVYGRPTKQQLNDLRSVTSNYSSLSDESMEELWLEEQLAEDFAKYHNNVKDRAKRPIIRRLFDKISKFLNWVNGMFSKSISNRNFLESVFGKISSGGYTNSNRRGTFSLPLFKLLHVSYEDGLGRRHNKYLSNTAKSILVSRVVSKSMEYTNLSQEDAINRAIQDVIDYYSWDNWDASINRVENERGENAAVNLENKIVEKQLGLQGDNVDIIKKEVSSFLSLFQLDNFLQDEAQIEEQEAMEQDMNTEKWDQEVREIGGTQSMSQIMKLFISTIYTDSDEFGSGDLAPVPIDIFTTYRGLVRGLSNTEPSEKLERLHYLAKYNPNLRAFYHKLLDNVNLDRMWKPGDGSIPDFTSQIYNAFISNFDLYTHENWDILYNIDGTGGTDEDRFKILLANTQGVDKQQVSNWKAKYRSISGSTIQSVKDQATEAASRLQDIFSSAFFSQGRFARDIYDNEGQLDKSKLEGVAKQVVEDFKLIGVDLSEGYILWSLIDAAPENISKSVDVEEFYEAFKDVQGFKELASSGTDSEQVISTLKSGLNSTVDPFNLEQGGEGIGSRLLRIAEQNAIFDETVGEATFVNQEGKRIYEHVRATWPSVQTNRMKNSARREFISLLDNYYDDPTSDNYNAALENFMHNWGFEFDEQGTQDGEMLMMYLYDNPLLKDSNADEIFERLLLGYQGGIRRYKSYGQDPSVEDDSIGATTWGRMKPVDKLVTPMMEFLQAGRKRKGVTGYSIYNIGTNAEKNTNYTAQLPAYKMYNKGEITVKGKEYLESLFTQEYKRIGRVVAQNSDPNYKKLSGYHTAKKGTPRGMMFNNFKYVVDYAMSQGYDLEAEAQSSNGQVSEKAMAILLEATEARLAEFPSYLEQQGITLDMVPQYYKTKDGKDFNPNALNNFFLNDMLMSMSVNQFYRFDEAVAFKNAVDIVKRNSGMVAAGPPLHNPYWNGGKIRMITLESLEIDPVDEHNENNELFDNDKARLLSGGEIDRTDAQSIMTLDAYVAFYLTPTGKLSSEVKAIYNKLMRGYKITTEEYNKLKKSNALMSPRKNVYRDGNDYIKTSTTILSRSAVSYTNDREKLDTLYDELQELYDAWPTDTSKAVEIAEKYKEINELWKPLPGREKSHNMLTQMLNNQVDYVAYDSAAKMRKRNVLKSENDMTPNDIFNLDSLFMREQVSTDGVKEKTVDGTQKMQLIWSEQDPELDVNFKGVTTKMDNIVKGYKAQKARRNLIMLERMMRTLLNSVGNVNYKRLSKVLTDAVAASGGDPIQSEYFKETLEGLAHNINLPVIATKAQQILNSYFSKHSLKVKKPGFKGTLVTDYLYEVVVDKNDNVIPYHTVDANPEKYINSFSTLKVRKDVEDLFKSNKGLANRIYQTVGATTDKQKEEAKKLYSQYLSTVFPDSQVKDIFHRNEAKRKGSKFNNFRKGKESTEFDLGFYFTTKKGAQEWFSWNQNQIEDSEKEGEFENKNFQYVLNLEKPKVESFKEYFNDNTEDQFKFYREDVEKAKDENYDSLIAKDVRDVSNEDQIIVFDPDQIHVLGSPKDIQNFKKFSSQPLKNKKYETRRLKHAIKDSQTGEIYSEVIIPAFLNDYLGFKPGDTIPRSLAKMVGVRIPTQDKQSMVNMRIVSVLPAEFGNTIIMPFEASVLLSGADFDIDAEYVYRYANYRNRKGELKSFGDYLTAESPFEQAYEEFIYDFEKYDLEYNARLRTEAENDTVLSTLNTRLLTATTESEVDDLRVQTAKKMGEIRRQIKLSMNVPVNLDQFMDKYGPTVGNNLKAFKKGEMQNIKTLTTGESDNLLLEAEGLLIHNTSNTNIANDAVTMKPIDDSAKRVAKLKKAQLGLTTDQEAIDMVEKSKNYTDVKSVHDPIDKHKASVANDTGATNIGIYAVANIMMQYLHYHGVTINKGFRSVFNEDGVFGKYEKGIGIVNSVGRRINDLVSTYLSAATDNGKDPKASLLNLTPESAGAHAIGIIQGIDNELLDMMFSVPHIEAAIKELGRIKAISTESGNRQEIIDSLDPKDNMQTAIARIKEEAERTGRTFNEIFTEGLENSLRGSNEGLVQEASIVASGEVYNLFQVADSLFPFSQTLQLSKGLKPTVAEMYEMDKNFQALGVTKIELDSDSHTVKFRVEQSEENPVSGINKVINEDVYLNQIYYNTYFIKNRLYPKMFITASNGVFERALANVSSKRGAITALEKGFTAFMASRLYANIDKDIVQDKEEYVLNNEFIHQAFYKEAAKNPTNPFFRFITPTEIEISKGNLKGRTMYTFSADTRNGVDRDIRMKVSEGFENLKAQALVDEETKVFVEAFLDHTIRRDAFMFRSNSVTNSLPPDTFVDLSKELDNFMVNPESGMNNILTNWEYDNVTQLADDFESVFFTYIGNKDFINFINTEDAFDQQLAYYDANTGQLNISVEIVGPKVNYFKTLVDGRMKYFRRTQDGENSEAQIFREYKLSGDKSYVPYSKSQKQDFATLTETRRVHKGSSNSRLESLNEC